MNEKLRFGKKALWRRWGFHAGILVELRSCANVNIGGDENKKLCFLEYMSLIRTSYQALGCRTTWKLMYDYVRIYAYSIAEQV